MAFHVGAASPAAGLLPRLDRNPFDKSDLLPGTSGSMAASNARNDG
jgi:hypothetical protein